MNKTQGGFTLIEVLIVLSVIQLLLSFGFKPIEKSQDKQAFNRWYTQFEVDLLYLQKRSSLSDNRPYLQFDSSNHRYSLIIDSKQPPLFTKTYDDDWRIIFASTKNKLAFNKNGQFLEPGTIRVETNYYVYTIVFPFGKGRCYVTSKEH
ncbi:hypothetical protein HMI01_13970 [Halolactibacillus miurensis]|uniref:Competence protein ComGD n=1 Tax=Halolactibacillus miurensis TaxID=306541 RepID=A0A1I6PS52_9BACI|nr:MULTISPECIES: competence type IV pilus minor pilin ComGD [Halolactibacillus]GEM04409.1 hypothetical protein HMI01_13970 [Halolactibacillus miurensis]SFS42865.1 competence protein ComGD [Halolactibacillus miurensis]